MTTRILSFDAIRETELEVWRSLAVIVRANLEHGTGSEPYRMALERISTVIADQVERTSSKGGAVRWTR